MNWLPKIEYIEYQTGISKTIQFASPPEGDPFNEEFSHKITKTTSSDGTTQVQYNYGEKTYSLEFIFVSESVKNLVESFFNKHAIKGAKFDYYPSSDEPEHETFEIDKKSISFGRPIPSAIEGEFEYNFKLYFRRVI